MIKAPYIKPWLGTLADSKRTFKDRGSTGFSQEALLATGRLPFGGALLFWTVTKKVGLSS